MLHVMSPYTIELAGFLLLLFVFSWFNQRRIEARFAQRTGGAVATIEAARRSSLEESRARADENRARQAHALEIAEQAQRDRQEMLALLRRIVELLEASRSA